MYLSRHELIARLAFELFYVTTPGLKVLEILQDLDIRAPFIRELLNEIQLLSDIFEISYNFHEIEIIVNNYIQHKSTLTQFRNVVYKRKQNETNVSKRIRLDYSNYVTCYTREQFHVSLKPLFKDFTVTPFRLRFCEILTKDLSFAYYDKSLNYNNFSKLLVDNYFFILLFVSISDHSISESIDILSTFFELDITPILSCFGICGSYRDP